MRAAGQILAALIAAGSPAAAQQAIGGCHPPEFIRQSLASLGEFPVMLAITDDGMLLEVYASPSGTFSIVETQPGGFSCLTRFGDRLLNALPVLPIDPQQEGDPA